MSGVIHIAEFPVSQILCDTFWEKHKFPQVYRISGKKYRARMDSLSFQLFRANPVCVLCRIEGNIIILDVEHDGTHAHFNMYHKHLNGGLTLMTKDHIIPKSRGGITALWNLQTMCINCNNRKANNLRYIEEFRRLNDDVSIRKD